MNVVSSNITHVEQEEQSFRTLIFFRYKNNSFFLELDQVQFNGIPGFRINNVYHDHSNYQKNALVEKCPFCGKLNDRGYCPEMTKSKRTLFRELKEHNNIRLYWLYQNVLSW